MSHENPMPLGNQKFSDCNAKVVVVFVAVQKLAHAALSGRFNVISSRSLLPTDRENFAIALYSRKF